jgi:hypothetical protein
VANLSTIAIGSALAVAGVIGAALARLLADEAKAWTPRLVEILIRSAVARLPEDQRERRYEEWRAHINDVPGDLSKLLTASGFIIASLYFKNKNLHTWKGIRDKTKSIDEDIRDKTKNMDSAGKEFLQGSICAIMLPIYIIFFTALGGGLELSNTEIIILIIPIVLGVLAIIDVLFIRKTPWIAASRGSNALLKR